MTKVHVEPLPILLIKSKHEDKSGKDFGKLKLSRDSTSAGSDLYEFKIALFGNGNPEEFFFVLNFNMTISSSGMMETGAKVQYCCTPLCG